MKVHGIGMTVRRGELVVWMLDLGGEDVRVLFDIEPMTSKTHLQSQRCPVNCRLGLNSGSLVHSLQMLKGWSPEQLWPLTCLSY